MSIKQIIADSAKYLSNIQ